MKSEARLILKLGAALAFSCSAISGEPAADPLVVGYEFKDISVTGVSGIFLTRREDHFTLQFQFCIPGGNQPGLVRTGQARVCTTPRAPDSPYPDVRVQLRDRNGALIPHLRRLAVGSAKPVPVLRGAADGVVRAEVIYTFRLSDVEHAESITLQIDGQEFVQKVPRLAGT
jgi:hypothetical protein